MHAYRVPHQTQIHCVVKRAKADDLIPANDKEATRINNWTSWTHQLHHPLGVSLPESTENPSFLIQKNAVNQNRQKMREGLGINATNSKQSKKGHQHELTLFQIPRLHLIFRFMSRWPWRIQQSRACVALQGAQRASIQSIK